MVVQGTSLSGRYLLQEQIGLGGMGTVWRGFDTVLERPVAVKLLNPKLFGVEGSARLLSEARAIARLDHPNIVSVFDAGEADGSPYIVMELVDGENLHDRPPANLPETVRVAGQICAGLEHAHSLAIIHRDLKPENVMIGRDGVVRLMDFGLARSTASRLTQEGQIVGTVFYLAPEQALGEEVDGRADLYSLGVILYELTTGSLPFTHEDPVAVISQHLHASPVPPRARNEAVPPALSRLILSLMSKQPAERPASAAEVGRLLASPTLLSVVSLPGEEPTALERIARGRMVGREKETALARGLWMKARGGQPQTLLIRGAPGVGKSRLLRELLTHAELTGGRPLGTACYQEGAAPYAGFRQIQREVFLGAGDAAPSVPPAVLPDLVALLPELAADFPNVSPHPPGDPHADQARLFESVTAIFSELIRREPLLLYLDDAHWADSGTLSLLRHLIRSTQSKPLMFVLTYREQELDQALPFHETLLDLERTARAETIDLKPLPRDQTRELLAAIFQEEITEEFLEGIHRETEGNPFFIEEVCKALVESGKLYYRDGRWHRPSIEELGIPKNVRVAVQSRVSRLPAESQEVLKQAAVLGRSIDPRVLRLATELEEDRLLTALEDAERAQLITPSENGQGSAFLFAHALIPSTLVEGLRIVERRRLHQRAAAAVEQIDPDASGRLAHHYLESGQQARGIEHLLRAGNEARLMHAHQEAIRCYRQAIDHFLGSGDHRSAGSALFRLALAYHNAFEFEAARTTYDQAFASLQRAASARSTGAIQASPHPLRLASGNPVTLDPSLSGDIRSNLLVHQLFSGLVEERPDAGLVPDIASSWEVTEGGTKYLFHLRPDARWSDGEPVLSTDFVYAWRRCLEPGAGSPLASLLYDIKGAKAFHEGRLSDEDRLGIRAPDPHSLIVELDQPANYFLSILSTPTAFPLPLRAIEAHGEAWTEPEHIVTNGPFRLRSWTKGESMSLERWRGYSGEFSGNVDRLDLRLYEGSADHLLAVYEANQLDALTLTEMTSDQHEAARQRLADQYVSIPVLSTSFVIFDNRRPPFADRRVRLAFAQAVDRERLADVALRGHQFPAKGSFVPPGIPGHFDDVVVRHDPDNSRQLLARAGFPGGTSFPIIDTFAPMEFSEVFGANELSRQWEEELGVRINVKEIPWTEFVTRMRDDPPRLGFGGWWADYPDPYNFLHLAGFGGYIVTSWHDDQYESLVQRGKMTSELEDRLDCYRRAEAILAEELPLFPVLHGRMHFLIKPWVSSFPTSPSRYWFFKDVVIEPH